MQDMKTQDEWLKLGYTLVLDDGDPHFVFNPPRISEVKKEIIAKQPLPGWQKASLWVIWIVLVCMLFGAF